MVWLIVSLPFASAASLSVVSISGEDGIENYYKSNDVVSIEVLAGMPGEAAVERDQLRVYVDGGDTYAIFDSCTPESGTSTFSCTMEKTVYGQSGSHDFIIKLYNDITKLQKTYIALLQNFDL